MSRIQATIRGIVGTNPALHLRQSQGSELPVTQFRLAIVDRYRDNQTQEWRDGDTQWITVSAFRDLAHNIAASVRKGERVIVEGTLRTHEYVGSDNAPHTDLRLEARSVGHDLRFGTSIFTRTIRSEALDPGSETEPDARAHAGTESYPGPDPDSTTSALSEEPLVGAPF